MVDQGSINPYGFAWKVNVMMVLMLVDFLCNAFMEHVWGAASSFEKGDQQMRNGGKNGY